LPPEEELSELPEEAFPESLLEEELEEGQLSLVEAPGEEKAGLVEEGPPPVVLREEGVAPSVRQVRRPEDVITEGIQSMMEDFIQRVVPQMAQNIMNLTLERVEQMVKEIVPELAEKAIQEEIKRLQMGEKD